MIFFAISQRQDINKHGDLIDNLEKNYFNYFNYFNIILIPIPNSLSDPSDFLEKLPISGIILSGGNDVSPKLYGSKETSGNTSSERDFTETEMIKFSIKKSLPLLGICRGFQFINVYFKGTLSSIQNHVAINHELKISLPSTNVSSISNSYHNQGILRSDLSKELIAFATSGKAIEGAYHPTLKIMGIQWHPERKSPNESFNKRLISDFIKGDLYKK